MTAPSTAGSAVMTWRDGAAPQPSGIARGLERAIALVYGVAYDRVVSGFTPYQTLLDDIVDVLARAEGGRPLRILDVACGTGTLARRLAEAGHVVTGLDTVPALVEAARRRTPPALADRLAFTARDVALAGPPGVLAYDVVVALHTIYWHPYPERLLRACWAALRPGGHAIVVAYSRAATVRRTLASVWRADGAAAAASALRWLVPTAVFEAFRRIPKRYVDDAGIRGALARAGFLVRETRRTFLGGVSVIAWAQQVQPVDHDDAMGASSEVFHPNGRP